MTPPTDPLEILGQRSALAVAERRAALDPQAEIAAVARRARRPRRLQIAALAIAVLVALPLTAALLGTPPRDIQFSPAPAPAPWLEVGRDAFNGAAGGVVSSVTVAGDRIVAVGHDPDPSPGAMVRPAAWVSEDGRSWDEVSVSDGGALYAGASALYKDAGLTMQDVTAVTMGEMEWLVAVGYANFEPRTEPVVWLSYNDGTTWELHRVAGEGMMTSVTATPDGLVAVGTDNGRPAAWTSFGGKSWEPAPVVDPKGSLGEFVDVAAIDGQLVAVRATRTGNAGLWTSAGGTVWRASSIRGVPDQALLELSSVSSTPDGGFLAAGSLVVGNEDTRDGVVLESHDGRSWEPLDAPLGALGDEGAQYVSAVASTAEGLLALGSDDRQGTIWSSAGAGWTTVFTDQTAPGGGFSQADRLLQTPNGLLATGIATTEQGPQEARAWLRPAGDPEVPASPPVEIIDQPIGTFGGTRPLGPVTANGVVLTAGGHGSSLVTATDESGAELWTHDLADRADTSFLGPVSGSTVLAASHYGQVVSLDVRTGTMRWSLRLDVGESPGAPTIDGGVVYVPTSYPAEGDTTAPRLYAVDRDSGAVLWRRTLEQGTDLQWAPPVVTDNRVLVADTLSHPGSAPTSWLHAVDRRTGERVWRFDLESSRQGFLDQPPLVHDGRVFVTGAWGPLFAVDLATGEQLWRRPADENPLVLRLEGDALIVELDGRRRTVDVEDGTLID